MTRIVLAVLVCSVVLRAEVYHFVTPQTTPAFEEAATIVRTVAAVPQVSIDAAAATLTFSGPAESVDFAAWLLPQIDKATGDSAVHEYKLPSGDTGRVLFFPSLKSAQAAQELLVSLRTVADVNRIFAFSPNHAMVLRAPDWQVSFSAWITDQITSLAPDKPDPTPRHFIIGGPDYRGTGHGGSVIFLVNTTSPRATQELLTVLRVVGETQKLFSYTPSHAVIFRANDTDIKRSEWIIRNLDLPAAKPQAPATFIASEGDDVTRIFFLPGVTPEWLKMAVAGLQSDIPTRKVFPTTTTNPPAIVARGTTSQIVAATKWLTLHNAPFE